MRSWNFLAVAICAVVVSACAVAPKTPEQLQAERVEYLMRTASTALANGDARGLFHVVGAAAENQGAVAPLQKMFAADPRAREMFLSFARGSVGANGVPTVDQAVEVNRALGAAATAGLLHGSEAVQMLEQLHRSIAQANSAGSLPFTLVNYREFPSLYDAAQLKTIISRSFSELDRTPNRRELYTAILDHAKKAGTASEQGKQIAGELLKANLKRSDLPALQTVYPELVGAVRSRLYVPAQLAMKGADRLAAEDLAGVVTSRIKGLEITSPAAVQITVERIRHNESSSAERRDTVTYAQHEVNLIAAALLMPRNASYIYDIAASEASIEYGYVVTVEGANLPRFEKVVRGRLKSETVRCSNARIQNVFGGTTSAGFVANDDMARRCHSGSGRSLDDLRREVLNLVADAAAQAPQLSAAATDD